MLDSPEWTLEWSLKADRQIRKLDKSVVQRVLRKLEWLKQNPNPRELLTELKDDWAGCHRLRVQEYRVILEILEWSHTLLVLEVGHRKDIYSVQ
ncbi:MAG: type II toxin-antitoxin system RelE/ParE family toxin [Microbacteriaceae bacterium]|nr:type II toxin-antitoxin system RelE/ParE family toxin [Microbacteriaceae bacterium]